MNNFLIKRFSGVSLVVVATLCFANSGIFIRNVLLNSTLTPVGLALWRESFTFCILFIGIIIFKPKYLFINKRDIPMFVLMGVIGVGIFHWFWNLSVVENGVAIATLLQYNSPIFVTVVAVLFMGENFSMRKLIAIILTLLGTALISILGEDSTIKVSTIGLMIGLGSAFSHGLYSLIGKRMVERYQPITVMMYIFGFGTLTLIPFTINDVFQVQFKQEAIYFFLALVLVSTVIGFGAFTISLKFLPASTAVIIATMEIPMAAFFAWLFLGERLHFGQGAGALLVICGVILISYRKQHNNV